MAQTIAVRAGAVSCNWSLNTGAPFQTLFTQSGGAARVILNCLEVDNGSVAGSGVMHLYIYSSGTGIRIPIAPIFTPTSTSNLAVLPGNINGPSGTYYALRSQDGAATLEATAASGINSTSAGFAQIPANFWMGNGDSLMIRGNWNSASGMCYYSFTTITES